VALIFDLETNGLLDDVTNIHCLVIKDTENDNVSTYSGPTVRDGIVRLCDATLQGTTIVGHNIIKYDLPVIDKLLGSVYNRANVFDTLVATRLIWSNIKDHDVKLMREEKLPKKYFGSNSLAAWGHRLGNYKGDYEGGWETFSQEMLDYNIQDVEVTHTLYQKILEKEYASSALELEHDVAWLMAKQERNGFCFDTQKAASLYAKLVQRRGELERELKDYFGSWVVQLPDFTPRVNNKKLGYTKGVPVKKSKTIDFNPSSRDHIADRLINLYGWKPVDFTEGGKPMVDEEVLSKLDYPPCKLLTEYLLIQKRAGQISEGQQAWLKCEKNGKIHGSINPNGAVTGRATHAYPNIAQVPSGGSQYGPECRELFTVPRGWLLVGADASGLELRCLAHFMAKWDGGKYADVLLGGDIHTENQNAAGLQTRNQAKTFIYAFLYGAGDAKIGSVVGGDAGEGRRLKNKFLRSLPALGRLVDAVQEASRRGYLTGLDGRRLHVRSSHAALNTLLQSAGALICKKWLLILEENLQKAGLKHGFDGDYAFCAWVHDEVQIACRNETVAKQVAELAVDAVRLAGDAFNFRCALSGEAKIGANWSETH
jgi:DNA polymerase I